MPDYNFAGLSTRSFEQLTQAIAAKLFGPNIIIFGDGPDGGREATFEGRVPYPTIGEPWNGYGVLQAKFRQRAQDAERDGDWALGQLRAELEQYADPEGTRRKPEYYIFATNVFLTSVQEKGSKDKVYALFEEYADRVPLKGFDVWDNDKICRYLDDMDGIRRTYGAWVTAGDVMAEIIRSLDLKRPDFGETLSLYLQKELLRDQYVDLEQAGHVAEDRIPMARVFVDLPAFGKPIDDFGDYVRESGEFIKPGFAADMVEAASERLTRDQTNFGHADHDWEPGGAMRTRRASRGYVLIGGPGGGKSTLGQFICQLFRAALLVDKPEHTLSDDALREVAAVRSTCASEHLSLPAARRFPVRVVLNRFAQALAASDEGSGLSLLSYIVSDIRRRTDREIAVDDFRLWLKSYPWLIVLDGLDEVPASSNRSAVLAAVRDFWVDVANSEADVLVIATTRPQGYNEDFSPELYRHVHLAPLSPQRAFHYARRLTQVRYARNEDQRDVVMRRLRRAVESETTARLMRSPLQVTIMAALVGQVGEPPRDNWTLFKEYYGIIYKREMAREIPAAIILRENRADIDAIHQQVGLLLQVRSEHAGGTDARLSSRDFARVVDARLDAEGHDGVDRERLRRSIVEAATERLVFLVSVRSDEVGFELRPLQEFMASEALTGGGDDETRDRLSEIAPVTNWRNVFLFAAGKCFAERQYLRGDITAICTQLNESIDDPMLGATLAGSRLALALLEDGAMRQQPTFARSLTRVALRLLDLAPGDHHLKLAAAYETSLEQIYREELMSRLESNAPPRRLGAWTCLLNLIERDVGWAREIGDRLWSTAGIDANGVLLELPLSGTIGDNSWLLPRVLQTVPSIPPTAIVETNNANMLRKVRSDTLPGWFRAAWFYADNGSRRRLTVEAPLRLLDPVEGAPDPFTFRFAPWKTLESRRIASLEEMPVGHPMWRLFVVAAQAWKVLSKERLARSIEEFASSDEYWWAQSAAWYAPWTLGACVLFADGPEQLREIATQVRAGKLGEPDDWRKAEERWLRQGVVADDFRHIPLGELPFDHQIAIRGFPFHAASINISREDNLLDLYLKINELRHELPASPNRALVTDCALFASSCLGKEDDFPEGIEPQGVGTISLDELRELADQSARRDRHHIDLSVLCNFNWDVSLSEGWIDLLDEIGRRAITRPTSAPPKLTTLLCDAFRQRPTRFGLLWVIALLSLGGGKPHLPSEMLNPELYDETFRDAAVIIWLSQRGWTLDEASGYARHATRFFAEHPKFELNEFAALNGDVASLDSTERLLLGMRTYVGASEWRLLGKIDAQLQSVARRRTSGLAQSVVWTRLKLPAVHAVLERDRI